MLSTNSLYMHTTPYHSAFVHRVALLMWRKKGLIVNVCYCLSIYEVYKYSKLFLEAIIGLDVQNLSIFYLKVIVSISLFRWWPAKILYPNEVPENIQQLPHARGEFVVQFFGSHNYNWVNRGRAFLYQEGVRKVF